MKTITLAIGSLASLGLAPAAQAEEHPFTGPRVEATIGYDLLTSPDALDGSDDNIDDQLSGIRTGVAAGYDWAIGPRLTIGAEIGIGTNVAGGITAQLARDTLRIEATRDIDVAARLGFRAAARTLIFARIGYANSRLAVDYRAWVGGGTFETTRYSDTASAVRLGAGLEHAFGGRFYGKAEYRWTRYGDDVVYQGRSTRHQLLAGVGVRF